MAYNLLELSAYKAVKFIKESLNDNETSSVLLSIKSKEVFEDFIDELKKQMEEIKVIPINSSGLKIGDRKTGYEGDLKGYPKIIDKHTVYSGSEILPHEGRCEKDGLIIFYEINKAQIGCKFEILEMIEKRKLFNYKLPDKWNIISISSGEFDGMDNFFVKCDIKIQIV